MNSLAFKFEQSQIIQLIIYLNRTTCLSRLLVSVFVTNKLLMKSWPQRFINRSKPQLSKEQQQNLTRWAVSFQESGFSSCVASVNILDVYTPLTARFLKVLFAASLVKNNKAVHEALMAAMSRKATVLECIQTIEMAS